jgi:hypothetical protein
MSAIATPSFDPLIEEARVRARRRRLAYLVAAFAAIVAVAVWGLLAVTGGGSSAKAPPGFTIVKPRGPVAHAVLHYDTSTWRTTDVGTGQDRPARTVEEIWYDRKSGLWRDLFRIDGRVKSDLSGRCRASSERLPCGSDYPLSYLRPYPWPPVRSGYVEAGRGSFHGRDVIWLEPLGGLRTPSNLGVSRFGLDPQTHRMVVAQSFSGGRLWGSLFISQKRDLGAARFRFLVPTQRPVPVNPNANNDPWDGLVHAYGLPAARHALGRPPLWLGPQFRGLALRSVTSGVYLQRPGDGRRSRPMPFVRFYYGEDVDRRPIISIEELGANRPYFEKQGPRAGSVERVATTSGRLTREGLLLRIQTGLRFQLTPKNAVALARGLRPLPGGIRTLPTLRQI